MNEVNIIPNLQMRKQKPVEVNVPIVIQLRNDGTKLTLIMQMYKINLYSLQQLEGFFFMEYRSNHDNPSYKTLPEI